MPKGCIVVSLLVGVAGEVAQRERRRITIDDLALDRDALRSRDEGEIEDGRFSLDRAAIGPGMLNGLSIGVLAAGEVLHLKHRHRRLPRRAALAADRNGVDFKPVTAGGLGGFRTGLGKLTGARKTLANRRGERRQIGAYDDAICDAQWSRRQAVRLRPVLYAAEACRRVRLLRDSRRKARNAKRQSLAAEQLSQRPGDPGDDRVSWQ